MTDPDGRAPLLDRIVPRVGPAGLWTLLVLAAVLMAVLGCLDKQLKNDRAPCGIVSFELAGSHQRAAEIVDSWGERGRRFAVYSLVLDFPFIAAYSVLLACWCGLTARRLWPASLWIAAAMYLAGALDVVENVCLLVTLSSPVAPWPFLAAACAWGKFTVLGVGAVHIVGGGLVAYGRWLFGGGK